MTQARTIVQRGRAAGAAISLDGDEIRVRPSADGLPVSLVAQLRAHKSAIHEYLAAEATALETARAIRLGLFPTRCEPKDCGFPIGPAGSACLRCDTAWAEHFSL